jgi:hypothetical protein
MSKYAILVTSASDTPEGRGKMAHALITGQDIIANGGEVKYLYQGIGVTWLKAFNTQEHPFTTHYLDKFNDMKPYIMGACNFCTNGRFDVGDDVREMGVEILGNNGEHFGVGDLVMHGYQLLSF